MGDTTVRLQPHLAERAKREAARRDVTVGWLVNRALAHQLPTWEHQDLDATVRSGE